MPDNEYKPLPPTVRRINEIAQFVGSMSLIASVVVIGFFFFFGSEDNAGFRFDSKHGWALLGDRGDPDGFEFELLPSDLSPRIEKDVIVRKKEGGVFLRPEPYYPFYAVIGGWFGFDRDAAVKGRIPGGTCALVNAITKTGFDSLWIHITVVDDARCGGPRPEPVADEPVIAEPVTAEPTEQPADPSAVPTETPAAPAQAPAEPKP